MQVKKTDKSVLFPPLPSFIKVQFAKPYWNLLKIFFYLFKGDKDAKILNIFRKKFGLKNAVLVDSGTTALYLALKDIGLNQGDEVIIPSFVCKTVANSVIKAGGIIRYADIDYDFNISPESIIDNISPKTKVVIAVHQYGKICRIEEIKSICKKHNLILIEDTAVPIGIRHKGKYAGAFGDYSIFSFNIGKTLVSFGGGVLVVNNNQRLHQKIVLSKQKRRFTKYLFFLTNVYYKRFFAFFYGLLVALRILKRKDNIKELYEETNKKEVFIIPSEMANLQKAATLYQLERLEAIKSHYSLIAGIYLGSLSKLRNIILPQQTANQFTYFPIIAKDRYNLAKFLSENGIETQWTFYPLHLQKKFMEYPYKSLKITNELWKKELSLPISPKMTIKQAKVVCSSIIRYYNGRRIS